MLSSVLSSPSAVDVNVAIMRAFVHLRGALAAGRDLPIRVRNAEAAIAELDDELSEHAAHINDAFAAIRRLSK